MQNNRHELNSISGLQHIFDIVGSRKNGIFLLGAAGVTSSLLELAQTMTFMKVVDGISGGSRAEFIYYGRIYLALMLILIILSAFMADMKERCCIGMEICLREHYFGLLQRAAYSDIKDLPKGDLINHLRADVNITVDSIMNVLPYAPQLIVSLIGSAVIVFIWDPKFTVLLLAGCILMLFVASAFKRVLKKLNRRVQEDYDAELCFMDDTLDSEIAIKAFRAETKVERAFAGIHAKLHKDRIKRFAVHNARSVGYDLAFDGAFVIGMFWWGFKVLKGTMSLGMLMAIFRLISQVQAPFAGISGYMTDLFKFQVSAERLMEIERLESDPLTDAECVDAKAEYEGLSSICARNLSFSYKDKVLDEAELTINKGDYAAFVGESGAGKSTLLKLLLALLTPDSGELYLSYNDGSRKSISANTRSMFAYVPQRAYFFAGNIINAVSFMDESDTQENILKRVRNCCEIACADEFIGKLKDGYETELVQRGGGISEGQLQRISIARALYSGAPILVFDEATSALDEETEMKVLDNIRRLTDRTVITVTHRKEVLSICSRIITVENGKFIE